MRDSFWQIFFERNITKFQQKFGVWPTDFSKCFSKLVIFITLCQQFWSILEMIRIEIQNAIITPSTSIELCNIKTVRLESWNVTIQQWEINNRKSEVIALTTNLLYSTEVQLAIYIRIFFFFKFSVIDGENIVKISRGIVEHIYKVKTFRFEGQTSSPSHKNIKINLL